MTYRPLLARALRCIALLLCSVAFSASAKPYKGAEVYSVASVQYGKIEMRMRMARGSGILSTFFLYKNGSEGAGAFWEEVDIEVFGKSNATVWQSNIISGTPPRQTSEQNHTHPFSLADGYHTFAIEWAPNSVSWYVDGFLLRRTEGGQANQLTNSESLRFNLWASSAESWVGPFDDAVLPQYQFVNWIRFYRYENGTFVLDWTDDFNNFSTARWARANWTFDGNLVDFDPANAVVVDGTLVLALTHEGQTGFTGSVPVDGGTGTGGSGGASGSGGSAGMGGVGATGGMGATGGVGATGGMGATGGVGATGGMGATGGATGGVGAAGGTEAMGGGMSAGGGGATGGAGAAGGAVSAGGVAGTSGTGALGGAGSSGGAPAGGTGGPLTTGGFPSNAAGASGAAGASYAAAPRPADPGEVEGGCACATGGARSHSWSELTAVLLGLGMSVRRSGRRRARREIR